MVFRKSRNLGVDLELKNLVFEKFSFFWIFVWSLVWVFVFVYFEYGFWFLGISSLVFDPFDYFCIYACLFMCLYFWVVSVLSLSGV